MFIGGTNFSLLYLTIFKGKIKELISDSEFKCYAGIVIGASLVITTGLILTGTSDAEIAIREALFQVVATVTTTGFCTTDYMGWHPLLWLIISGLMYFGACSGSTTGGMKCVRVTILSKDELLNSRIGSDDTFNGIGAFGALNLCDFYKLFKLFWTLFEIHLLLSGFFIDRRYQAKKLRIPFLLINFGVVKCSHNLILTFFPLNYST